MSDQVPVEVSDGTMQRRIRSPRAAAVAGILFALLMTTSMILLTSIARAADADLNVEWLADQAGTAKVALTLVPFAGIAFLWFTGVIRDRLGEQEDQFFATVFLGSGLIFLTLLFMWAALIGAMLSMVSLAAEQRVSRDVFVFGFEFMNQILANYTLRMAGVYMLSIGTLWSRTAVMPRWLTIITYVGALGFIFFANAVRDVRFLFPAWVLLVSIYILITNLRSKQ